MAFDTELLLEKLEENRPVVIVLAEGSVQSVYICPVEETPASLEYFVIDTDNDEVLSEELDTVIEILESCGYSTAVETRADEYIAVENSGCSCDDDETN